MPELVQHGEEYFLRTKSGDLAPVSSWDIGVFDNSTDLLGDTSDLDSINTEPENDNYNRQTINADNNTFALVDGNVEFEVEDVTFNFQDNSTDDTIDSWFIVIEYESNVVTSDEEPTDHLIVFGDLSEERNLGDLDNLTVENIGTDID